MNMLVKSEGIAIRKVMEVTADAMNGIILHISTYVTTTILLLVELNSCDGLQPMDVKVDGSQISVRTSSC